MRRATLLPHGKAILKSADALVDYGCNAVAYYVPWFVHEYEEGKFDFTGELCPENDLHTWIQLKKRVACWASSWPLYYAGNH